MNNFFHIKTDLEKYEYCKIEITIPILSIRMLTMILPLSVDSEKTWVHSTDGGFLLGHRHLEGFVSPCEGRGDKCRRYMWGGGDMNIQIGHEIGPLKMDYTP